MGIFIFLPSRQMVGWEVPTAHLPQTLEELCLRQMGCRNFSTYHLARWEENKYIHLLMWPRLFMYKRLYQTVSPAACLLVSASRWVESYEIPLLYGVDFIFLFFLHDCHARKNSRHNDFFSSNIRIGWKTQTKTQTETIVLWEHYRLWGV